MKKKIGEFDIIDSGTIVGIENEPIDFILVEDLGFIVRIVFETNSEFDGPKIVAESHDKVGAKLILNNFNNSIGIGNIDPIHIGTLNNRELFLNYRVHSLDKGGKTFHYTWLLGKEVENVK